MMVKTTRIFALALIMLAGLVQADAQALAKMTFVPHWLPQAQFAGYYVAREMGFYQKHGIDLTIMTGGPQVSAVQCLEEGKADFASLWLTKGIQRRSIGKPIINLAQLINRSALMLVAKKSSGITTPQDMNGKKIGLWGDDFLIQPQAFFKKYNLKVKTVQQGGTINLFFLDGVDVTIAMWYNEYHTILNSGFNEDELNTFFFSDHGLNFPEDGIYCREDFYLKNEALCRSFVQATLEGWQYAFNHPDQAIETVIALIHQEKLPGNNAHQKWVINRMFDLIFPEKQTQNFETLTPESYKLVSDILLESGLIKTVPDYQSFYKPIQLQDPK